MTNKDLLRIAMEQSAADIGCKTEDFLSDKNVIVPFKFGDNVKKYYKMPIGCNCISYGNNIVVSANEELYDLMNTYINKFHFYHCFENPNMQWLNAELAPKGYGVCFMAEYYLPDLRTLKALPCDCELKVLTPDDFASLYLPEWSNAICKDRKELDVLGVGAYDNGRLIGMSGCSSDADEMWQIGIDVLPEYRRKGIASALTTRLAMEILERDKVPFYCTAWSNIRSVRNAFKCSFVPTWVEMTIKPLSVIEEINSESK